MPRYISLLLFFGLSWGQDTTIAVFDFENNGLSDAQVRQITIRLEDELVKTGGLKIVERKDINAVLEVQKLQMSGMIEDSDAIKVGAILGATHIIIGSIGKIEDTYYTITAKLINAETSELIKTASYDAEERGVRELIQNGLNVLAQSLLNKYSALVDGKEYIVSIDRIFLDDKKDFGKYKSGLLGSYYVGIMIYKNYNYGKEVSGNDRKKVLRTTVDKRGLLVINERLTLKYNKNDKYDIRIFEGFEYLDSNKRVYWIKSEKGDWIFSKGRIEFGANSYIELSQVEK